MLSTCYSATLLRCSAAPLACARVRSRALAALLPQAPVAAALEASQRSHDLRWPFQPFQSPLLSFCFRRPSWGPRAGTGSAASARRPRASSAYKWGRGRGAAGLLRSAQNAAWPRLGLSKRSARRSVAELHRPIGSAAMADAAGRLQLLAAQGPGSGCFKRCFKRCLTSRSLTPTGRRTGFLSLKPRL